MQHFTQLTMSKGCDHDHVVGQSIVNFLLIVVLLVVKPGYGNISSMLRLKFC